MAIADDRQHLPPRAFLAFGDQPRQQRAADAAPAHSGFHVDRFLEGIAIGRARAIESGVAVADDSPAPQRDQPGQPVIAHGLDPFTHFVNGGGDLFEGGAAIKHVPDIQRGDGVRIVGQRFTNF